MVLERALLLQDDEHGGLQVFQQWMRGVKLHTP
jgi:hypothetical protein